MLNIFDIIYLKMKNMLVKIAETQEYVGYLMNLFLDLYYYSLK